LALSRVLIKSNHHHDDDPFIVLTETKFRETADAAESKQQDSSIAC
jgi:hypothetical protein